MIMVHSSLIFAIQSRRQYCIYSGARHRSVVSLVIDPFCKFKCREFAVMKYYWNINNELESVAKTINRCSYSRKMLSIRFLSSTQDDESISVFSAIYLKRSGGARVGWRLFHTDITNIETSLCMCCFREFKTNY